MHRLNMLQFGDGISPRERRISCRARYFLRPRPDFAALANVHLQGAMRMPVRFNIGNANAVLDVILEAFQLITVTMQILPQSSASSVYSVTAQYETAASYLRIQNVDWWTLYWKLALVIAFIWMSSMIFIQVRSHGDVVLRVAQSELLEIAL
jgi:hypothetical protein